MEIRASADGVTSHRFTSFGALLRWVPQQHAGCILFCLLSQGNCRVPGKGGLILESDFKDREAAYRIAGTTGLAQFSWGEAQEFSKEPARVLAFAKGADMLADMVAAPAG